jgi:hypothetical protein
VQATNDGSDQAARAPSSNQGKGVLESTDQLEIKRDGALICTLHKCLCRGPLWHDEDATWRRSIYRELLWSQRSAQLILMGVGTQDLMFPEYLILQASHRAVYHPRPGAEFVEVAQITANPKGLDALALFARIMGSHSDRL